MQCTFNAADKIIRYYWAKDPSIEAEREQLMAHLRICPDCQANAEHLLQVNNEAECEGFDVKDVWDLIEAERAESLFQEARYERKDQELMGDLMNNPKAFRSFMLFIGAFHVSLDLWLVGLPTFAIGSIERIQGYLLDLKEAGGDELVGRIFGSSLYRRGETERLMKTWRQLIAKIQSEKGT